MKHQQDILNNFVRSVKLKYALIKNIKNVRYLTGFTGTSGILFLMNRKPIFITDPRYSERAEREVKVCPVKVVGDPLTEIIFLLKRRRVRTLGVEFDSFTLLDKRHFTKSVKHLKFKDVSETIAKMRSVKTDEELKMIRKASQINKRIFESIIDKLRPGITEIEISRLIENMMREFGCDPPYFTPIVAVDPGSAVPHHSPGKRRIRGGRGVLIDFGSVWQGYSTDETISVHIGKPDNYYRNVWIAVRDAKNYAISSIKPGVRLSEPEKVAREYLRKKNLEKFFTHSLGHGVGLEIHEGPRLSLKSKGIIEEGMVFTVEPGVYIKGKFGIRLEDVVYVSSCGAEVITMIDKGEVLYV